MSKRLLFNNMGGIPTPPPIPDVYKTFSGLTPYIFKNTKEGEMQEVEILGHTWQDFDGNGKNLFNKEIAKYNTMYNDQTKLDEENLETVISDYIKVKPNTEYISTGLTVIFLFNKDKRYIRTLSYDVSKSFKTNNDVEYVRLQSYGQHIESEQITLVDQTQLEEGRSATEYEAYHKADYSNIKHLGELQSDGKYKITVKTRNNLFNPLTDDGQNNFEAVNTNPTIIDNDIIWFQSQTSFQTIEVSCDHFENKLGKSYLIPGFKYTIKFEVLENNTNSSKVSLETSGILSKNFKKVLAVGETGTFYYSNIIQEIPENNIYGSGHIFKIKTNGATEGDLKVRVKFGLTENFEAKESEPQTLLLDQPLMSAGDVQDRLFYDNSKNEYIIEKKVNIPLGTSELITDKFIMPDPQLISTGIKQEIKLNSYNTFTHCSVDGGIYGGIKLATPIYMGIIELPVSKEGSGTYLGNHEFEITDTSKWDNVSYLGNPDAPLRAGQKYNLKLTILAKDIKEGANIQQISNWQITHTSGIIEVPIENMNVGDVFDADFSIFNLQVGHLGRIIGFQFNTNNTGSYFKWKAEIREVI